MRKFNIFTVFFVAVIIAATLVSPNISAFAELDVKAEAVLLVETKSGKILYENNKDKRVASNSLAGVMTLLLAAEAVEDGRVSLEDEVTASETFLDGLSEVDTTQDIKPGEKLSFLDLMHCVFLASASDASNILAEQLSGSASDFVDSMNEKAHQLGCSDTYFTNAGGRPGPNQYTSAWDQYLIFKEAIGHPLLLKIAKTLTYRTEATAYSSARSLLNANAMLQSDNDNFYQYCIMGKTGYPGENVSSIISCAEKNDLSLIAVVLEAKSSVSSQSFLASARLFERGFSGFALQDIVRLHDKAATVGVVYAKGTDTVEIVSAETMTIMTRSDLIPEDVTRAVVIYGLSDEKVLTAPVREGDLLGQMTVYIDGTNCGKVNLTAAHTIELDKVKYLKSQISQTLSLFWVQFIIFFLLISIIGYLWLVIRDRRIRRDKRRHMEETKKRIIDERQKNKINR